MRVCLVRGLLHRRCGRGFARLGFLGFLGEAECLPFIRVAAELRLDLFLDAEHGVVEVPFSTRGLIAGGIRRGLLLHLGRLLGGQGGGGSLHSELFSRGWRGSRLNFFRPARAWNLFYHPTHG